MVFIERVTTKEELAATRKLLAESLEQLDWIVREYPRLATSDITSVLERGKVAIQDNANREGP